ncbi:MAG TPA: CBS domain-containing protein [Candidatus Binataceae bacterium]|jgi:acetoin utilization protein AcuB|nr:CBS domain-containing protein [Candidatus Binataceae bacterium]
MIVARWMTKNPITIKADDTLAAARRKMDAGKFRRLPVVEDGALVGIITDRDLRQHVGALEHVRVDAVMSKGVVSVTPSTMLEQAAYLLVKHKIGAMPVVDAGKLVGIVSATDLLRAFAEVLGATEEGVSRIDLALAGDPGELATIGQLVAGESGEILGMGTYPGAADSGARQVLWVRLRSADASRVARMLNEQNFTVLAIHP